MTPFITGAVRGIGRWFNGLRSSTSSLENPAQWLLDWFSGRALASGVQVNPENAMGVSAIYACVKVIAEDIATMPFVFYENDGADARKEAIDHPLYEILGHEPNPEMDSGQFIEMLTGHVCLRGNAYAEVVRDANGNVQAMWPLHPQYVRPRRFEGELVYEVTIPNPKAGEEFHRVLDRSRIFHLKGLSSDGVLGLSPVELHAESIGLSIALERHGAALFGNGAVVGGVLETEKPLTDKTYERLKKLIKDRHEGLDKAHRTLILESGLKWKQVGLQNDHAQFIDSRRLQIEESCRIFRMAQIMVSAQEKSSSWGSGIEQMQIGHVNFTLRPWAVRWERAVRTQLLLSEEKARYFARFRMQALMRGDNASRSAFYDKMMGMGAMSANDIRRNEDENPREGGNVYFRQQTLVPFDSPGPMGGKTETTAPARKTGFVRLLESEFSRSLRRSSARITASVKKPIAELNDWASSFARDESRTLQEALGISGRAIVEMITGVAIDDATAAAVDTWSVKAARRQLTDLMDEVREIVAASPLQREAKVEEAAKAWPSMARETAERELERIVELVSAAGAKEKAA